MRTPVRSGDSPDVAAGGRGPPVVVPDGAERPFAPATTSAFRAPSAQVAGDVRDDVDGAPRVVDDGDGAGAGEAADDEVGDGLAGGEVGGGGPGGGCGVGAE